MTQLTNLDPALLSAIEDALAKATPGPWHAHITCAVHGHGYDSWARQVLIGDRAVTVDYCEVRTGEVVRMGPQHSRVVLDEPQLHPPASVDADLIVLLRNHADALLASLRAQAQENARLLQAIKRWDRELCRRLGPTSCNARSGYESCSTGGVAGRKVTTARGQPPSRVR